MRTRSDEERVRRQHVRPQSLPGPSATRPLPGEVAERTGLCRDTIFKIEMGQRSPRLDTLLTLADALSVDAAKLLDGLRP